MRNLMFIFIAVVAMFTNHVSAQASIDFYCEAYDTEAKMMMFPTGITVTYNNQIYSMTPVNVLPQGIVYSNYAGANACISMTCQNMRFRIGNDCMDFVARNMTATPSVNTYQYGGYGNSTSGNPGSAVGSKQCSLCHGKGYIAGTSTPTYGNGGSYYCNECNREVPASHSHDRCPSCGGKGTVPAIR